jgi:type II secretory ATPase GspE/PulE/Tfp pilus assembly ATPase PilB-like protein
MRDMKKIGQLLFNQGLISSQQLSIALIEQQYSNLTLGQILLQLEFVTAEQINQTLADQNQMPRAVVTLDHVDLEVATLLPESVCRNASSILVSRDDSEVMIWTSEIDLASESMKVLKNKLLSFGFTASFQYLDQSELEHIYDSVFGYHLDLEDLFELLNPNLTQTETTSGFENIELVDRILIHAFKQGASDIHFETEEKYVRLRYRLDGVLQNRYFFHQQYWPALVVRLKVLADLDIAEKRKPQDGHFSMQMDHRLIDFRISTMPVLHGESIVLRILDRAKGLVPLEKLGFSPQAYQALNIILQKPQGIVLVTGPTGSGKTTSLYSILQSLMDETLSILTLEDPVEYPLKGVRQTPINKEIGLSFMQGVKAQLRQDPDIIFIGEIRDNETADMALRAALTGHKVFATLHCSSALSALPRLAELGISSEQLAGNVSGIIAQRLLRKLCPNCRQLVEESSSEYKPCGCQFCHQGYRGRVPILEVLNIDHDIEQRMFAGAGVDEISQNMKDQLLTLAEDGRNKVKRGLTSYQELRRVIDLRTYDA